ncbi:hypothetical protein B0T26DRAFT_746667 [Lasiosphaeria miniovina]|uniref:Uncharacterized protein n=1 Tax=Lasiosphaeria miniovina TaxID=1954250 RepID=A0AA40BIE6_9PEZI|nr:uncharacterized protein B0T26DRAFT_746667 [Lasiosphaeria miniovina]KAK0734805.1 hypothetical protein B0T26DRAFT_746667 [Lasiosphaeria miniovina]
MAPSRGKSVYRVCQTVDLQPVNPSPYSRRHAPPGDRRFVSAGVVWTPWTHDEAHDEAQDRDCLQMWWRCVAQRCSLLCLLQRRAAFVVFCETFWLTDHRCGLVAHPTDLELEEAPMSITVQPLQFALASCCQAAAILVLVSDALEIATDRTDDSPPANPSPPRPRGTT